MFILSCLVLSMSSFIDVPVEEVAAVAARQRSGLVVAALDRSKPISHRLKAPAEWTRATDQASFDGKVQPGEFYVFQIGVVSSTPVQALKVSGSLKTPTGKTLKIGCLNLGGIGPDGKPFAKQVSLTPDRLQMLWMAVDVPKDATGPLDGSIKLKGATPKSADIKISFEVAGPALDDHGVKDAWRLSRLRWLDSKIAQDRTITKPYTAIVYSGNKIRTLTHEIELADNGLPKQIRSFLDESIALTNAGTNLLREPLQWTIGHDIKWSPLKWLSKGKDQARWQTEGRTANTTINIKGQAEFDGYISYSIRLESKEDQELNTAQLEAKLAKESSRFIAGIGVEGRRLTENVKWRWDISKHQDTVWLGSVRSGCSWRFRGDNYKLPLCNIYYEYGKLANPDSWNNQGQGGIDIDPVANGADLKAYSGKCRLEKGKILEFTFDMRLTPAKPIDTDEHWRTRYIHSGEVGNAIEDAKPGGYNTVNVHQGNPDNPFINYPYSAEAFDDLKKLVEKAHAKNLSLKVYYTTRELTQNLPELDALYSLNGEVIFPGPGESVRTVIHPNGPHPWLKEHFDGDYIPAWVAELGGKFKGRLDLALITTPDSRWNNFYLEGLDYLVKKAKIDGLYIDDSALDRLSLLRARRILERSRPNPMIDLHSWNHFNDMAGYACNILMYAELIPYIDRIWFGEGFDYDRSPDYWLVEMAGLPFGVMSEMLQGGGNPWRGMLFGMTQRLPWSGDPRPLWAFWDSFGMAGTTMLGWWDSRCPVKTSSSDVQATVYRGKGKALIAVASWSNTDQTIDLKIDWTKLGLDPSRSQAKIKKIDGYQDSIGAVDLSHPLSIPAKKGYLIEVVETP